MTKHLLSKNSIYRKCCMLFFSLTLSLTLQAQKEVEKIKTYLRANTSKYQLTARDIDHMAISSAYLSPTTGWYHVYFNQTYQSIEVYNGLLNATIVNDNVAHVANNFVGNIVARAPGDSLGLLMSPVNALAKAALSLNLAHNPANNRQLSVDRLPNGKIGKVVYTNADLSDENIEVKLYWVTYNNSEGKKDVSKVKLSWDVRIMTKDHKNAWSVQVDAVSGDVLKTSDKIIHCSFGGRDHTHFPDEAAALAHANHAKENQIPQTLAANSYNVFDYPLESPNHGSRTIVTNPYTKFADAATGPGNTNGWHTDGTNSYTNTRGNNVWAKEDRYADNEWSIGVSPDSPSLEFDYSYTQGPNTYLANQNAAITNLFYWNNLIHDVLWKYGFDETAGNFQQNNMSRGGNGNDFVFADAQDGSGSDNANFYTPSDGANPRMQMFLWSTGGSPQYQPDSDFDNAVIAHEYGHGWSIRLTGGPANVDCLWNDEQGGEGWSDYLGLMLTTDWSLLTPTVTSANIPRGIGTYVLTEPTSGDGIRPYRYSYDMANINAPVTYGKVASYAIPHGIGSIWATMLWDMTWEIIMQDNRIINNIYNTTELVGNAAAFKLVNEGLRLQPCSPSFIDARNAILKADSLLFNGRYKCSIWKAFARRGLGVNASTGASSNDTYVVEDFTPATDRQLTSPLNVTICSGSPIGYTATTSAGGTTTYNWTRAAVAGISNPAASGSSNIINEALINTTGQAVTVVYKFYLTPSSCLSSQDVVVTVTPSPVAEVGAYSVCKDGSVPDGEGLVMTSTATTNIVNGTLTNNSPSYIRGYGNGATTYYSSGASVHYQTHTFTPTISGYVTFETTEAILNNGSDDNYITLYQNSFDPNNPANNFLMGDDDTGYGWYASITYPVVAGTTYILVGSTYSPGYTGTYRIQATSPVFGGVVSWYTTSSGGTPIATGSVFNPVGVEGSGIPNTSTPGTTLFYASSAGANCRTPTTFTINPYTVGGSLAGSTTVCSSNNTGVLTLSGHVGAIIRWESSINNFNDITVINDTTATLTFTNLSQTTQYRAVVKSGACSQEYSSIATITYLPGDSPIATGASRCEAGSVTLTATGCTNGTVNWYSVASGGTIIATGTSYATPGLSVTTTYYVNCSVSNCGDGRVPVTATITSTIVPVTTGAGSCGNAVLTLTATGCANGTLNWYTAISGGSPIAVGASYITPTLSTTTTYYVGCSINNCNSVRAPVTATITQTPDNPIAINGGRCGAGTVILTATGCDNGTINWFTAMNGGSSIATGTSFTTPSLSATTTYYINCTVNNCVSNGRAPIIATISAGSLSAPSGTGGSRCGTGSVTLTAVGCAGGGTLSWFTSNSGGSAVATGETYATPTISGTTTYYVACVLGACSSTRVPVVATVNPGPAAPTPTNINRCGSGPVTLTAAGCSGGDIYWYTTSSGGLAISVGASYTTSTLTNSVTYYISCVVGSCASDRVSITATVNPVPSTPSTTSNSRCDVGSVTLAASGCVGGTINWYTASSGGSAIATGASFNTPSIANTTTYYASCMLGPCASNRVPAVATVNPAPGAPTPTSASRCDVGSLTLTATGCAGGTINWYTANSGGSAIATGTSYPISNLSATTTYYVACTVGPCSSNRVAVTATINPIPDAPSVTDVSRCGAGNVSLTATGCSNGTISWYTATSGGALLTTGTSYNIPNLTSTTTYYVSCTVGACVSVRTPVVATINPNPTAPTPINGSSCGAGIVNLTATGCAGGTINWFTAASGGSAITAGTSYTTSSLSITTTYYISCTIGICTSDRVAITATINPIPDAPGPVNASRCGAGTVNLTATGCNGGTLNWYTTATGGSAIGEGGTFTTPSISTNSTYYVACVVGSCVSSRVPVLAIVNTNLTYASGNQAAGTYRASQIITSASDISTGTDYFAGQAILLMPGFQAGGSETFTARILECEQSPD